MPQVPPHRIYVRAPNWVGDFVMATSSFERLRRAYPDAHITCGLRPYLQPLTTGAPWFDEMLAMPRGGGVRGFRRQVAAVRAARCDLAVVFPNSLVTALVARFAGVPRRLGYRQGRPLTMSEGPKALVARRWWQFWKDGPRRVPVPMPQYYEVLLDRLDIPQVGHRGRLYVTGDEEEWRAGWLAEQGVGEQDRLLLITAGASFGASKLWVPQRFAAVGRHFRDAHGLVPVVLAGPGEVALAERIAADIGERAVATTRPVLPLNHLKALVQRAALMITGDTGPRHLAVAFEVPTVVLVGPTDRRYTDYCLDRTVVLQKTELECVPCQRKVCPLGHHKCMEDMEVPEVVAAGERLL